MLRYLLLIFLLLPQLAFAAAPANGPPGVDPGLTQHADQVLQQNTGSTGISLGMFTPPAGDMSVAYLADMFGVVDGVLHGSGSQIMGTIFGVFNSAVLMLGAIILMYILIVSTLNTAHEGEVMGKNWSSIWIPIKSVFGFAMVIPKASGYCFIQIFVMWVVVQGVGAADTVWSAALNYLARGGTLIQASNPSAVLGNLTTNTNLINPTAANIFKSQVCMYGLYNSLVNTAPPGVTYPDFTASLATMGLQTNQYPPVYCPASNCKDGAPLGNNPTPCDCSAEMEFPGNVGPMRNGTAVGWIPTGGIGSTNTPQPKNYHGVCGNVTWDLGFDKGGGLAGAQGTSELVITPDQIGYIPTSPGQISNPSGAGASDSRSIAVNQIVLDVQPLAQTVANIMVTPQNIPSNSSLSTTLQSRNDIASAAVDYMGIMLPYLTTMAGNASADAQNLVNENKNSGWILAGSYYYQLASLNKAYSAQETSIPTSNFTPNFAQCGSGSQDSKTQLLCNAIAPYLSIFQANLTTSTTQCPLSSGGSPNPIDMAICYNMTSAAVPAASPGSTGSPFDVSGLKDAMIAIGVASLVGVAPLAGPIGPILLLLLGSVLDIMNHVNALGDTTTDPLLAISALGNTLVKWSEVLWVGGTLAIFITSVVSSIGLCLNPLGMAVTTALLWFLPMMMVILIAMFTSGAVMAYYVPLIPWILFLFTTIGWFAAVIESMVAAPLVAIGITHPEGHPYLGKSEPAVMLLANVFMRPTLIIIGFIAGAMLSHVALWLLNQGFVNVLPTEPHDLVGFVSIIIVIVIYVSIVMSVINRSFALIHEVPNRVMRWLGQGVEQFGEEGGAKEVHGAAEGVAKTAGSGMETSGRGDQSSRFAGDLEKLTAGGGTTGVKPSGASGQGSSGGASGGKPPAGGGVKTRGRR